MDKKPSANGSNGRDAKGKFSAGNPGGPGNPNAKRSAQLRSALLAAVKVKDIRDVVAGLVKAAKGGDVAAAKVLLDRVYGKPVEFSVVDDFHVPATPANVGQSANEGRATEQPGLLPPYHPYASHRERLLAIAANLGMDVDSLAKQVPDE